MTLKIEELQLKLQAEETEYNELAESVQQAQQQLQNIDRDMLVRQGRISMLKEQIQNYEEELDSDRSE